MYFAEDLRDEPAAVDDMPRGRRSFVGPARDEGPHGVEQHARRLTEATMVEVEPNAEGWSLRFALSGRRFRIDFDRRQRATRFLVDARHAADALLLDVLHHFRRLFELPPRADPDYANPYPHGGWAGSRRPPAAAQLFVMLIALGMGLAAAMLTASMMHVPRPPRAARPPRMAPPAVVPVPPIAAPADER